MTRVKIASKEVRCKHIRCRLGGIIKAGEKVYVKNTGDCYHQWCHAEAFPVREKFSGRNDRCYEGVICGSFKYEGLQIPLRGTLTGAR